MGIVAALFFLVACATAYGIIQSAANAWESHSAMNDIDLELTDATS